MPWLKTYVWAPFQKQWKLLLILSLPAVGLACFGLHQLNRVTWVTLVSTCVVKGFCEFLFLGLCLATLNLLGVKNKWVLAVLAFFYYITVTADGVLLLYFRERFGAKYVDTLQGGDYNFMTDWRLLLFFVLLMTFCVSIFRRFFTATPIKETLHRFVICAAGFALCLVWTPLKFLPAPDDFYTSYLVPPSLIYVLQTKLLKTPQALFKLNENHLLSRKNARI